MRTHNHKTTIRKSLNISYITLSISTIILIVVLVFSAWQSSNNLALSSVEADRESAVIDNIDEIVSDTFRVISMGKDLIEKNILDVDDPLSCDPYFVDTLSHIPTYIYSYSFGTVDGEYYGARRAGHGIEIMLADATTDFHSVYYSTTEDHLKNAITMTNNVYDPRSRAWYQLALEMDRATFSPVYKHFVMDDLAVSAAITVKDKNGDPLGVLGAHMVLGNLNDLLEDVTDPTESNGYIINSETKEVIANSLELPNWQVIDDAFMRIDLGSLVPENHTLINAVDHYYQTGETEYHPQPFFSNHKVRMIPYKNNGIDWLIIIDTFNSPISDNLRLMLMSTLIIIMAASILSVYIWNQRLTIILKPITNLTLATTSYTQGAYHVRAQKETDDEIGRLVDSFNTMANTLNYQRENLELKVAMRTKELEDRNRSLQENQQTIMYLSYHDQLTGLYNRRHTEEYLRQIDHEDYLPISLMMLDMNGLKLLNDAFGHDLGDTYLKDLSFILSAHLPNNGIAARFGGDEFVVVLPNTTEHEAFLIKNAIRKDLSLYDYDIVPLSVSIGLATKNHHSELIADVLNSADQKMYAQKVTDSIEFRKHAIDKIYEYFKTHLPLEHEHAVLVQKYALKLGEQCHLGPTEMDDLKEAAYMHDIGKISIPKAVLEKQSPLTPDEEELMHRHPEIGYRILSAVPRTKDYATVVLYHHENYDGTGYPNKAKEEDIPLLSRIIRVAESYITMTTAHPYQKAHTKEEAIQKIIDGSGKEFDPKLIQKFLTLID